MTEKQKVEQLALSEATKIYVRKRTTADWIFHACVFAMFAIFFGLLGYYHATSKYLQESASIESNRRDLTALQDQVKSMKEAVGNLNRNLETLKAGKEKNDRDMYYFHLSMQRAGIDVVRGEE